MAIQIVDTGVAPSGNIYNTIAAAVAAASPGDKVLLTNSQVHAVGSQVVLNALAGLQVEARTPTAPASSWPVVDCPVAGVPSFQSNTVDGVKFNRIRFTNFTDGCLNFEFTNNSDVALCQFLNGSGSCIGVGGGATSGATKAHPANAGLQIIDVNAETRYEGNTFRKLLFQDITSGDGINQGGAFVFTAEDIEALRVRGPAGATDVIATHHAHQCRNDIHIRRIRAQDCWGKSILELKGHGGTVEDVIAVGCSMSTGISSKAHENATLTLDPTYNLYNVIDTTRGNARNTLYVTRSMLHVVPNPTVDALWGGTAWGAFSSQQGGNLYISHCGAVNEAAALGGGLAPASYGVLNGHMRMYNCWHRGYGSHAMWYGIIDLTGAASLTAFVEDPLAAGGHTTVSGKIILTNGNYLQGWHEDADFYTGATARGAGVSNWYYNLPTAGLGGVASTLAFTQGLYASLTLSDFQVGTSDALDLLLAQAPPVTGPSEAYFQPGLGSPLAGAGQVTPGGDSNLAITRDYLDQRTEPSPPDIGPLTVLRDERLSSDLCLNDRTVGPAVGGTNQARSMVNPSPITPF